MPLKQRGFTFPSQRYYFMVFVLLFYVICVRYISKYRISAGAKEGIYFSLHL